MADGLSEHGLGAFGQTACVVRHLDEQVACVYYDPATHRVRILHEETVGVQVFVRVAKTDSVQEEWNLPAPRKPLEGD